MNKKEYTNWWNSVFIMEIFKLELLIGGEFVFVSERN